ncbi:PTS lactose/cellobiose transporter subunit IIA [Megamonas sp.]
MNTEKVAFDIISLAGDAKAELQKALKLAREGKFGETDALLDKASEQLQQAHKLQTQELLTREANGEKLQFNVLISHAQDYLMTTYTLKDVAVEIISLYRLIKKIKFLSIELLIATALFLYILAQNSIKKFSSVLYNINIFLHLIIILKAISMNYKAMRNVYAENIINYNIGNIY